MCRRDVTKPGLSHIADLEFVTDPEGVPLTFCRSETINALVEAFRERRHNFKSENDRRSRASWLPAVLAQPGSGKSHALVDLTRLAYTRLFRRRGSSNNEDAREEQEKEPLLGEDAVVSVFTCNGGMVLNGMEDSIFFRMAYGSMYTMGPKEVLDSVSLEWGRTDEAAFGDDASKEDPRDREEVPLNIWPICGHMKHVGDFSAALEEYTELRKKHGVDDPKVARAAKLLLELYERPDANLLILGDELGKAEASPSLTFKAQIAALSSVLVKPNHYAAFSALSPKDTPITFTTKSNRRVLYIFLGPLEPRAAQKLVEVCCGGLDLDVVSEDVVRSVLTFAAGNPRVLRVVLGVLLDKASSSGDSKGTTSLMYMDFGSLYDAIDVAGGFQGPVPEDTSAEAVAYVLRTPPSGTDSPLKLKGTNVEKWPMLRAIEPGDESTCTSSTCARCCGHALARGSRRRRPARRP